MKERPILFSAPMVRAILAGSKTQTRRVVKRQPPAGLDAGLLHVEGEPHPRLTHGRLITSDSCPYGQPGDRLWVREAWREWSDASWHYAADLTILPKQRDRELANFLAQRSPLTWESYKWRPSIHMPRAASRITLEVTGVRVERLQDISEADAEAEGTLEWAKTACAAGNPYDLTAAGYFECLWSSINGRESWDANPWVWVLEFKRVTP